MISRIRIEVRAASMDLAQREAEILMGHARVAGFLEGVCPQSSSVTDHHFGWAGAQRGKPGDWPDDWSRLGLDFEGRIVETFRPEKTVGGLRQYGHVILELPTSLPGEDVRQEGGYQIVGAMDFPKLRPVSDRVMVLERENPVTREHSWEGTVGIVAGVGSQFAEVIEEESEASAEEILDNIRRLVNVKGVTVGQDEWGGGRVAWAVVVELHESIPTGTQDQTRVRAAALSLREAALDAYGRCGQDVTHYDTEPPELTEDSLLREMTRLNLGSGEEHNVLMVGHGMEDVAQRILAGDGPCAGLCTVYVMSRMGPRDWELVTPEEYDRRVQSSR